MRKTSYLLFIVLLCSCKQFEDHSNDGLYAGFTLAGNIGWVINGNQVSIYYMGSAHQEELIHGNGYVKLKSNGYIMRIINDPVDGKYLLQDGLIDTKLFHMSDRTDIPEIDILEAIDNALTPKKP